LVSKVFDVSLIISNLMMDDANAEKTGQIGVTYYGYNNSGTEADSGIKGMPIAFKELQ
jgi:hypothetical protein